MNANDLLDIIGEAKGTYIEQAQKIRSGEGKPKRLTLRRAILIAAMIALVLLLLGCTVAYTLRLQDLKIAERPYTEAPSINTEGELTATPTEISAQVLTLHGIQGTPAYLAAQEWYEFTESYDKDRSLMRAADENPQVFPEAYEAYSVYTQEMADKVDEIAQKYDLKLLGAFAPFQRLEKRTFYEATGIESLLLPDSPAQIEKESGYFYEGGNFKVEFHMTMPKEEDQWPYEMLNSMYYSKSDYFDRVYMVIGNLDDWEQWSYTTKSGMEVLVMWYKDGGGAQLFCTREDALIQVSIEAKYLGDDDTTIYMTKDQLKKVADALDFTITVEDVDMALAREKLGKFINQQKAAEETTQPQ